jgi:5-methylcytosine-specific restriction endonuclease McrA
LIGVDPPRRDYPADFWSVSENRHGRASQLLTAASRNVFRAYGRYVARSADASRVLPLRAVESAREALRSNYPVLRDGVMYGELLRVSEGRCPMCGFGEASTLDHYLPLNRYPEFSVFAMNLVPACARCNQLKGELVGKRPEAQFLHAFFDEIPLIAVLVCRVDVQPRTVLVKYRIRQNSRVQADVLARMHYQFGRLQLADRFERQALNELGDRIAAFEQCVAPGANYGGLRDRLRAEARAFRTMLGPNHWKTALYLSLRQNRAFWSAGFRNLTGQI